MTITKEVLEAALVGFAQQKAAIDLKVAAVNAMLRGKEQRDNTKEWSKLAKAELKVMPVPPKRRKMSASARKAIGDATRRRWAAYRKQKSAAA